MIEMKYAGKLKPISDILGIANFDQKQLYVSVNGVNWRSDNNDDLVQCLGYLRKLYKQSPQYQYSIKEENLQIIFRTLAGTGMDQVGHEFYANSYNVYFDVKDGSKGEFSHSDSYSLYLYLAAYRILRFWRN